MHRSSTLGNGFLQPTNHLPTTSRKCFACLSSRISVCASANIVGDRTFTFPHTCSSGVQDQDTELKWTFWTLQWTTLNLIRTGHSGLQWKRWTLDNPMTFNSTYWTANGDMRTMAWRIPRTREGDAWEFAFERSGSRPVTARWTCVLERIRSDVGESASDQGCRLGWICQS